MKKSDSKVLFMLATNPFFLYINRRFQQIASLCNGSTIDSESICQGSSPCEATIFVREALV